MLTRISLLALFFSSVAFAQPAPSAVESDEQKTWSVDWYNKYQSSLHGSGDPLKRSSINSTLVGNYMITPKIRIQGAVGAVQAIQPALDFRVINPEFRGFFLLSPIEDQLRFYIGPTMALPFGTDAREESLIFSAGLAGRVLLNLKHPDGSGWRTYYDLTFNKNFHQYETSVLAQVNNHLSLNHTFLVEYNFDSKWSANASFAFSSLWNYQGLLTNNYTLEQELDFQINELFTLYASHLRGGDFLAPNGQNYSFGIFDRDSSRLSLGVILSL